MGWSLPVQNFVESPLGHTHFLFPDYVWSQLNITPKKKKKKELFMNIFTVFNYPNIKVGLTVKALSYLNWEFESK